MPRTWAKRRDPQGFEAPPPPKRPRVAQDRVSNRIPEWKLQEGVCIALEAELRARPGAFAYSAGMEGVRLTAGQRVKAKATGMQAGEPDLRFYFPGGRLVLVELKADGGRLNPAQKDRHAVMQALGFIVHTVKATSVAEASRLVLAIVRAEMGR